MIILNNNKCNQNAYRGKINNDTYSLHSKYEDTTLSNMQRSLRLKGVCP